MKNKNKLKNVQKIWVVQYTDGSDPGIQGLYKSQEKAFDAIRREILEKMEIWDLPKESMTQPSFGGRVTWFISYGDFYTMYYITEEELL